MISVTYLWKLKVKSLPLKFVITELVKKVTPSWIHNYGQKVRHNPLHGIIINSVDSIVLKMS